MGESQAQSGTTVTTPPTGAGGGALSGTLRLFPPQIDVSSRTVMINGADSARPTTPFHFDWGDGSESVGFFPQTKVYGQEGTYTVKVVASYGDGSQGKAETTVSIPVGVPTNKPEAGDRSKQPAGDSSFIARLQSVVTQRGFEPIEQQTWIIDADSGGNKLLVQRAVCKNSLNGRCQKLFIASTIAFWALTPICHHGLCMTWLATAWEGLLHSMKTFPI